MKNSQKIHRNLLRLQKKFHNSGDVPVDISIKYGKKGLCHIDTHSIIDTLETCNSLCHLLLALITILH